MGETATIEDNIRPYLIHLRNPEDLVDQADLEAAEKAVQEAEQSGDPIDKLKALAERDRVKHPDPKPLRDAFVRDVKEWAEGLGITAEMLMDKNGGGVPAIDLQEAGFEVHTSMSRRSPAAAAAATQRRAPSVTVEVIKEQTVKLFAGKDSFKLVDVMGQIGGSQATARKALDELAEAGEITKLGFDPDHTAKGRAPIIYKVGAPAKPKKAPAKKAAAKPVEAEAVAQAS